MTDGREPPDRFVRIVRRFDATPERVFDAWLDPAMTRLWLFTSAESEANTSTIDARVGGTWSMTDRRGGVDYTAGGEYLVIDRPRRLVFTFAMLQFSPGSDTITVELNPDGDGCAMTFTQQGVDIADELRALAAGHKGGTEEGWHRMFAALEQAIAG